MAKQIKDDIAFEAILDEAMEAAKAVLVAKGFNPEMVHNGLFNADFRDTLYHEIAPCAPADMVEDFFPLGKEFLGDISKEEA